MKEPRDLYELRKSIESGPLDPDLAREVQATNIISIIMITILIIVSAFIMITGNERSGREFTVTTYVRTTCLQKGYPEFEIIENEDGYLGFCHNTNEALEINIPSALYQ